MAVIRRAADGPTAAQRFVWQTHPLYETWAPTWRLLGEVYEGDGGFLDGSNLIPHPRELIYPKDSNNNIDPTKSPVEKDKFIRRKQIARYENFAQSLVDLFVDHQYTKGVQRIFGGMDALEQAKQPIVEWWKDVDGEGTPIDEWLKQTQVMADVYGHVFVTLDRSIGPVKPRTAAEESPLYLRVYTPLDAPDWLAPNKRLTAIKFIEAVERRSLNESSIFAADAGQTSGSVGQTGTGTTPKVNYRTFTRTDWSLYNSDGERIDGGAHGFGELPVIPFYARRRPKIPVLGRSLLRDPKLFKDHYNLTSEFRELLRAQAFAMLHIELGEGEEVAAARANLGDHAGTDTVLWTRGSAEFIAAPSGPAEVYMAEIAKCESKMFRLIGMSDKQDSNAPETEGSRRLKAMDLNRLLSGHADEAQRFDYTLARLWYAGTYGAQLGRRKFTSSGLSIIHPDEFYVEEMEETIKDTLDALKLPMGITYQQMVLQRAAPKVLREAGPDELATVNKEIADRVKIDEAARVALQNAEATAAAAPSGFGQPAAGGPPKKKAKLKKTPAATPPSST